MINQYTIPHGTGLVRTVGVEMKLQHVEQLNGFGKYKDLVRAVFPPFS